MDSPMPTSYRPRLSSEASSPHGGFNIPQWRLLTPRTCRLGPTIVIRPCPEEQVPCICNPAPVLADAYKFTTPAGDMRPKPQKEPILHTYLNNVDLRHRRCIACQEGLLYLHRQIVLISHSWLSITASSIKTNYIRRGQISYKLTVLQECIQRLHRTTCS